MFFENQNKKEFYIRRGEEELLENSGKKEKNPLTDFFLFDIIIKISCWEGECLKWKATIVKTETDA